MSEIILKVENLSKQYRLGQVGTGTLSHDINRLWARLRRKEDPYSIVGQTNDRTKSAESEYVWALKDINFEVKRGEVIGVIGRNGAGKSTLLKILSKITGPTTGSVKMNGRVASLLEVGTGMHPELTARENVYLNGAILGMTKAEITSKFDEIIDFAGVALYVDTPVKRFSSGMKVRLGFAVAAFLEPEILIVDEVLAVGDDDFQRRAIGKIKEVSQGKGRTVLIVSHNMTTISNLCFSSILLENGTIKEIGKTRDVIETYLSSSPNQLVSSRKYSLIGEKSFQVLEAKIIDKYDKIIDNGIIVDSEDFYIEVIYLFKKQINNCFLTLKIKNSFDEVILLINRKDFYNVQYKADIGKYKAKIKIQNPLLMPGFYTITIGFGDLRTKESDHKRNALNFKIQNLLVDTGNREGRLLIPTEWEMRKLIK